MHQCKLKPWNGKKVPLICQKNWTLWNFLLYSTLCCLPLACFWCTGSHCALFCVWTQILTNFDDCCTAPGLWDERVADSLVQSACVSLTQCHVQPSGNASFGGCSRNGMLCAPSMWSQVMKSFLVTVTGASFICCWEGDRETGATSSKR